MLLQRGIDLGNPVADHPLNNGLVSWYLGLPGRRFGTKFPEVKSNGTSDALVGTVTAPWTAGSSPDFQAFRFNNDRTYSIKNLVGNAAYTVAFRYLLTSTPSFSYLLEDGTGGTARLGFDSGSSTVIRARLVTARTLYSTAISGSRGLGTWNTGILTRQVGAPCYWYCNGNRSEIVASGPAGNGNFNRVGGAYLSGFGLRGALESVAIYNYAMSDSQALALTNQYDMGYPDLLRRTSRKFMLVDGSGGGGGGFLPAWASNRSGILGGIGS